MAPPATEPAINGRVEQRAEVDTTQMPWSPSPSGTVWRKRVHLVGPPESGQVTSIVRYDADSSFPAHDHPGGEEILVLEGLFSDEHGDWPAGTYLLNPEGFRHAPFSKPGCVLFVKLRQYPGTDRRHVVVDTEALAWQPSLWAGVEQKPLYAQQGFTDVTCLERWAAGASPGPRDYSDGAELYLLDGSLRDADGEYRAGTWLRLPAGYTQRAVSPSGCTLYIKRAGLRYLESA